MMALRRYPSIQAIHISLQWISGDVLFENGEGMVRLINSFSWYQCRRSRGIGEGMDSVLVLFREL